MRKACSKQRESVLRAAEEVADLQHDKVPGREHLVEIVRVDLEQVRGHSSYSLPKLVRQSRQLWQAVAQLSQGDGIRY